MDYMPFAIRVLCWSFFLETEPDGGSFVFLCAFHVGAPRQPQVPVMKTRPMLDPALVDFNH